MSEDLHPSDRALALTAEIVAAFVRRNRVPSENLDDVIRSVHRTMSVLATEPGPGHDRLKPAVPIAKSVHPDFIVCLEDGRKLKMLKRYLRAAFGMTPDEYRKRWGLPADYPMVAPNYAARRSDFAKSIGLGKSGKKQS